MGYKLAGYEVLGDCEIDPQINRMYVKNHHPKYNFLMGVQDFYKEENLKNIPDELYDLDVLDGSPPCSTFSLTRIFDREERWGKERKFREGQAKQELSELFFEFIKVAELLKPKVVVAENVKGLVSSRAKGYVNLIRKCFNDIGYDVQIFLLNAATMGVPQVRERFFFICRRTDLNMPAINLEFHGKPILYGEFADEDYKPFNKDTMTYLRWTRRKTGDRKLSDAVERTEKGKTSGFSFNYIYKNMVPLTIATREGTLVRFDKPGSLSDRDIKIISTFPQDYDFDGNSVQYVCGMSVPPFMMRGVAKAVQEQLLDRMKK